MHVHTGKAIALVLASLCFVGGAYASDGKGRFDSLRIDGAITESELGEAPAPLQAPATHLVDWKSISVGMKEAESPWNEVEARRRVLISSLWAFASLNYLYCDVVGLMDSGMLSQYLSGTVGGMEMSEGFLLAATAMMEIPLSMVFLSNLLDLKAARVANVAAGIFMTAIQTATLFAGRPSSYYLFSSVVEIATTAFIAGYSYFGLRPPKVMPVAAGSYGSMGLALSVEL